MDPARWRRVQTLFHEALVLPESERLAFLESACDDASLIDEVLALIDEDARTGSLLSRDLGHLAGDLLQESGPGPQQVGPYRVVRRLGHGGMGVVYLAEREDLGSQAAIKVLRDATLSPARRQRFTAEERTLAQLSHPSIARLYDADVLPDGTPFFVMEYVDGVPLDTYCETQHLSLHARLRLFRQVCEAVQHAHRHLIIHRDLKPSNILVTADGSPKLLDFGIAKHVDALDTASDSTQTGLRLMTPAFAAPEQINGDAIGIHTDVYALGVILYVLLTGRLPFDLSNRTPGQVEATILEKEPDRPSSAGSAGGAIASANRAAREDLDVLCLTAMHKNALRRYRTVDALIRDVDHFLGGEPLEARPDSLGYRLGKFLRRNRSPVLAGTVAVVAVIGLVAFYTIRLATARDAALAEAARTQRIQQFMLNLFEGGDEAAGPADTLRVVTVIERGVQEAGVLDAEPVVQAELYETLGGIYRMLGSYARADSLLNAALAHRRKLFPADHAEVGRALVALGSLRTDQAKLEDAETVIREGLGIVERRYPPGHPSIISAQVALGRVLQERGEYDAAVEILDRAARLPGLGRPGAERSDILGELANTHFYAGNLETADSLNRLLLEEDRRIFGPRHPRIADGLINLGAIQFERGRYAEAERYYRDALEIMEAYYGEDHPKTGSNLTLLGRAIQYQPNRYDEAEAPLLRSLAIVERAYGPFHPRVASAVNDLGVLSIFREDLDKAEAYFQRMLAIYDSVYRGQHYLVGIAVANLGSVYLDQQQHARAEASFRRAISVFTEMLAEDHLQTGIARIKLGRSLARQRRWAEAEAELITGVGILKPQTDPNVSWLRAARNDLVTVYEALNRSDDAARYRAEIAELDASRK